MQTFLPLPDFAASARVLDRKRLGKQRGEVLQILRALNGASVGWRKHPAVRMWKGFEPALAAYGQAICAEWTSRGYVDTRAELIAEYAGTVVLPPWFGSEAFHSCHRAVLLAKDFAFYSQFGWAETPAEQTAKGSFPYVWPEAAA